MRVRFNIYRETAQDVESAPLWSRFLKWFSGLLGALLLLVWAVVLLFDPYGVVPFSLPFKRDLTDLNQRYFYPLVIRQGRYDSLIVGTSTIRLIDPKAMQTVLGGRIANLAMNAGTAWEQWKLIDLQLREKGRPRNLVIGLDLVWCWQDADKPGKRTTERGFPEWLYDENRWNDILYVLNGKTLEITGRAIGVKLGLQPPRYRDDGFRIFTPPEQNYDLAKARAKLFAVRKPDAPGKIEPPVTMTQAEQKALRLPAMQWLRDILRRARTGGGRKTEVVLLWTPPHRTKLPIPGSREDAEIRVCKTRVDAIAREFGAMVVDWSFLSPLTRDDSMFWDSLHYRLPIAGQIIESIGQARGGKVRSDAGIWVRRTAAAP